MRRGSTTTTRVRRLPATTAGVFTVLALLAGGTVAVAPSAGAQAKPKAGVSPPALISERSPETKAEIPAGDFRNPPSTAGPSTTEAARSSFDAARSTPVDAETTPTRRVYANPDRTRTAVIDEKPVRFKNAAGTWQDFDLTLVPGPDGALVAKAAPDAARLGTHSDAALATVATKAGPITLIHPGAIPVQATTTDDRATFPKALGAGRDLVLSLTPDGYEEKVILADAGGGASYLEQFSLPAGVTARNGPAGVEFLDAGADVVATYGGGVAFDATFPRSGPQATTPVSVRLSAATPTPRPPGSTVPPTTAPAFPPAGGSSTTSTSPPTATSPTTVPTTVATPPAGSTLVTVEVAVAPEWLAAAARVFPVTIDPTMATRTTLAANGGFDTWVSDHSAYATTSWSTHPYLIVGSPGGGTKSRSALKFDVSALPIGADTQVIESHLSLYNWYSVSCTPSSINVYGLGTPPAIGPTNIWSSQPPVDGVAPTASVAFAHGGPTCATAAWQDLDATALARRWLTGTANNGMGLQAVNETDANAYRGFYSAEQSAGAFAPTLSITYNRLPTAAVPSAPADGAVLVSDRPTLAVNAATDPDGDPVQYWFRAGTGPNVEGGHGIDSGWLTTPSWTMPAGVLADGTYRWFAFTSDGVPGASFTIPPAATTRSFRSTLRLGAGGPAPADTIGPVRVNLASGNVVAAHASPQFPTVGGSVGVGFTYNSAARINGLVGDYYANPGTGAFPTTPPTMSRRDPNVAFYWGPDSPPSPTVASGNYMVRWTGNLTTPASAPLSASYTFFVATQGGVRMWGSAE